MTIPPIIVSIFAVIGIIFCVCLIAGFIASRIFGFDPICKDEAEKSDH